MPEILRGRLDGWGSNVMWLDKIALVLGYIGRKLRKSIVRLRDTKLEDELTREGGVMSQF